MRNEGKTDAEKWRGYARRRNKRKRRMKMRKIRKTLKL